MPDHSRRSPRAVLTGALLVLAFAQGVAVGMRVEQAPRRPLAVGPLVAERAGDLGPAFRAAPPRRVPAAAAPAANRAKRQPSTPAARAKVFGGLGAWVDRFDIDVLSARAALDTMKAAGVRTLYIQTATYKTPYGMDPRVRTWLVGAHKRGIKVVGWYLPGYGDVAKDTRRTLAIAHFEAGSHRFDGLGIDIEVRGLAGSLGAFNRKVAAHAAAVRKKLPRYPVASITPSPLQMRVAPHYWAGFPWKKLARVSDSIMTMSYWSERDDCPQKPLHCAYDYTLNDVKIARRLTGGKVPIHIIGGIANSITIGQVRDFARAAKAARAYGASLYDFHTTVSPFWKHLRALRVL